MVETTKSSNVRDVMGPESPVATFVGTGSGKSRVPFPRVICPGAGGAIVSGSQHSRFGSTDWNTLEMGHSNMFPLRRTLTTAEYLTSGTVHSGAGPSSLLSRTSYHRLYASIGAVKTRRRA